MENPKIKACPFCGETWCSLRNAGNNGVLRQVYCRDVDCGVRGPARPSEDHAIAAWNNRAGDRQPMTPESNSVKALVSARCYAALSEYPVGSLKKLLKKCDKDADASSMLVLGESFDNCDGCVVVLKGQQETKWLRDTLADQQLLNPQKPIIANAA